MPKHRGTVYTVVRETVDTYEIKGKTIKLYTFSALVGTYTTYMRAEEVAGSAAQVLLEAGADPDEYQFSVKAVTYYDE